MVTPLLKLFNFSICLSMGACRLTSIKGLVRLSAFSLCSLSVHYTVKVGWTTSNQFMTVIEPIRVLADFVP